MVRKVRKTMRQEGAQQGRRVVRKRESTSETSVDIYHTTEDNHLHDTVLYVGVYP
jgi:hypothetical protein